MPWIPILIVLLLTLLNGFFALSELAIVSSRRARLQQLARRGNRGAERALVLAEDPTAFLSTVQIGITLIGIGAVVGLILAAVITQFPFAEKIITPYILLLVTTPMLALVPLLILLCGVITYLVLPLEPRLRLMILLMDVFGAIAVGLLLWRQGQR